MTVAAHRVKDLAARVELRSAYVDRNIVAHANGLERVRAAIASRARLMHEDAANVVPWHSTCESKNVIRKVAFAKAALGGAAGAAVWEIAARGLAAAGVHAFDVTRSLGTLVSERAWWPFGMAAHALIGVIWSVFYAYFFWAGVRAKPVVQGLLFSIVPAMLAGFVMIPELGAMHGVSYGVFAWRNGVWGPLSVFAGHALWGVTMGAIYTHPVGTRVRRLAHA